MEEIHITLGKKEKSKSSLPQVITDLFQQKSFVVIRAFISGCIRV